MKRLHQLSRFRAISTVLTILLAVSAFENVSLLHERSADADATRLGYETVRAIRIERQILESSSTSQESEAAETLFAQKWVTTVRTAALPTASDREMVVR